MKIKKILVVYKHNRSFVMNDLEILKKHYEVIPFKLDRINYKRLRYLRDMIKEVDLIFIWFASYHAFLTTLMRQRKPVIVVTGGYDVAKNKELNYGLLLNPFYSKMVKYVLNKARFVLSVSKFNGDEIYNNLNMDFSILVYNGVDPDKFIPKGKKEKICLTVGYVTRENWIRKGIRDFVQIGKEHTGDYSFVIVGKIDKEMQDTVKEINKGYRNIYFTGYENDDQLLKWYQKAKYYYQLSRYESFGISLAEAMLCGCIPVISDNGALPEVRGNLYYTKGSECRKHIIDNFTLEKREKAITGIIGRIE